VYVLADRAFSTGQRLNDRTQELPRARFSVVPMNRRQYTAMTVGVVGSSLAGCTTVAGETELTEPTESRDDHSVRFVYDHEGETLARVNFNTRPDTPWKQINEIPESPAFHRLRVGTEQPGDVRLDSLSVSIRARRGHARQRVSPSARARSRGHVRHVP
jgi:hypothetical protein